MCICHLQHLLEKSPGNMGPLLTKITSLTIDTLQQRGHWEQSLLGGFKKIQKDKTPSPPPVSLSCQPGQNEEECENVTPPCQFESAPHRLMCPSISLHHPPPPSPSQAALLLWSCSEGRSYYWHRAQVRMASRQHTIKA